MPSAATGEDDFAADETSMDASNLMASVSNQGLLSHSSGKVDDLTEVGETSETAITPEDEFLMQDDGTNGDLPRTTAVLAGDLSMDLGTTGTIGGIPEDMQKEGTTEEMFDEQMHRMDAKGHTGAFFVALLVCGVFVRWFFGTFFTVQQRSSGWANLPNLELSKDAKMLFNSVDKQIKV